MNPGRDHDDPPLTSYVQISLVNFMYNANISFPLEIAIGAEQTGQQMWGDSRPHLMDVPSLNTYL